MARFSIDGSPQDRCSMTRALSSFLLSSLISLPAFSQPLAASPSLSQPSPNLLTATPTIIAFYWPDPLVRMTIASLSSFAFASWQLMGILRMLNELCQAAKLDCN